MNSSRVIKNLGRGQLMLKNKFNYNRIKNKKMELEILDDILDKIENEYFNRKEDNRKEDKDDKKDKEDKE